MMKAHYVAHQHKNGPERPLAWIFAEGRPDPLFLAQLCSHNTIKSFVKWLKEVAPVSVTATVSSMRMPHSSLK